MRKLVLKMSISLDGFVCGPGGELDWLFKSADPESTDWTVDRVWRAGLHLMGSRTFRDMAAWWPYSTEPFAPPMNEIPKAVFSRRGVDGLRGGEPTAGLKDAERARASSGAALATPSPEVAQSWANPLVLSGNLAEEVTRLKQQPGKEIVAYGGAAFAQNLVATGLVDEYCLLIHPVALGRGRPLFSGLAQPAFLELVNAIAFPAGAVAHVYRPARP
jgi:dihydrofolate reductase